MSRIQKIILVFLLITVIAGCKDQSLTADNSSTNLLVDTKANTAEINSANSEYIEIAKEYIVTKPDLKFNGNELVSWDNLETLDVAFSKVTPEWIISQKSTLKFYEIGKFNSPNDYLNNKYVVSWFFIPGCNEEPKSNAKPNWFNEQGIQCLGGYSLRVIINPEKIISHVEINALA